MKTIRHHLVIFTVILLLSGITAFPIQTEIALLNNYSGHFPGLMDNWIKLLFSSINKTPQILFYGTDWLAFAHIVISLFFIPVYIHPAQYKVKAML